MTLSVDEADELAGAIGIIVAAGPLLWMINQIGEAPTVEMLDTFETIISTITVPASRLIAALLVLSLVYSLLSDSSF